MRYPADHKEETHDRIVQAASRRFRKAGAYVAIHELMGALKLTHGGFYRHFRSKEDLFAQALDRALEDGASRMALVAEKAPGHELEAIVRAYLSEAHCSDTAGGCPIAALMQDIARHPPRVRAALERALRRHAGRLSASLPGENGKERQRKALALFSGMAGVLSTARAVTDEELRRNLLEDARRMFLRGVTPG